MSLWGKDADAITNRPKWAPTDENSDYNKGDIYATNSGWVRKAGTAASGNGNVNADPEVLVAIRGLAGVSATTGLKAPTPVSVRFITDTLAASDTEVSVEVTYDEAVTVTGTPTVATNGANVVTLSYVSGTANQLVFTGTGLTLSAGTIIIGGGSQADISLSGGTIVDTADGSTAAGLVLTGIAAVTVTVSA